MYEILNEQVLRSQQPDLTDSAYSLLSSLQKNDYLCIAWTCGTRQLIKEPVSLLVRPSSAVAQVAEANEGDQIGTC